AVALVFPSAVRQRFADPILHLLHFPLGLAQFFAGGVDTLVVAVLRCVQPLLPFLAALMKMLVGLAELLDQLLAKMCVRDGHDQSDRSRVGATPASPLQERHRRASILSRAEWKKQT